MVYSMNLGKWNRIFAVPSEIIDKYIKSSSEVQIKVLLWMLRHAGEKSNLEKIAEATGFTDEEIKNAVVYWKERDLILVLPAAENSEPQKNSYDDAIRQNSCEGEKPKKENLRYHRPDSAYIANRMQSSGEIYFLMQEAQVILGRPISNGDSGILLMLHDNDGLPVDVIIMLLQYAVNVGKANMKYIEKMGMSWASEGINDHEKAEKKIQDLNRANVSWKKFENIIGIYHRSPSASEEEAVSRWIDGWNYCEELIKEAYDRCVNANGKYVLKYIDSIIKRWHNQGIVTIEQALAETASRHRKKSFSREDNEASYSIDEYESYNIFDYIKS